VNAAVGRCAYSRVIFPSMILFSVALCASILPLRVSGVPYCSVRYILYISFHPSACTVSIPANTLFALLPDSPPIVSASVNDDDHDPFHHARAPVLPTCPRTVAISAGVGFSRIALMRAGGVVSGFHALLMHPLLLSVRSARMGIATFLFSVVWSGCLGLPFLSMYAASWLSFFFFFSYDVFI
jgi:hypothetical protein